MRTIRDQRWLKMDKLTITMDFRQIRALQLRRLSRCHLTQSCTSRSHSGWLLATQKSRFGRKFLHQHWPVHNILASRYGWVKIRVRPVKPIFIASTYRIILCSSLDFMSLAVCSLPIFTRRKAQISPPWNWLASLFPSLESSVCSSYSDSRTTTGSRASWTSESTHLQKLKEMLMLKISTRIWTSPHNTLPWSSYSSCDNDYSSTK